tara:strand:+ start:4860 stop:6089 length:1230 start_codon:yes stop_codon:yes gene_type:complete
MTLDLDFVREQFPALTNEWIFMDNAGGSQILKGCVANINEYYYANNVQLGGSYELSQAASRAFSEGREKISMLFNAKSADEIVFGPSTTVLLQFLSKSLASFFQPGDEVIVTSLDHESNIGPWLELEKIGVKIKFWELNANTYTLDLEDLEKIITKKTKLVAFVHVSNIVGTINPVKEFTKFIHDHGAMVCVDAVAYAPHRAIDVVDWNVDFYALSLYKTYGPHHAALYCRMDHMVELDNLYHFFYGKDKIPAKMEPGNANYELSYGSGAIVDYLVEIGSSAKKDATKRENIEIAFDQIADHEVKLNSILLEYLCSRRDCTIIGSREGVSSSRVPTVAFTIDGKLSDQICVAMDEHKIAIRYGDFHARRLSDRLGLEQYNGAVRISLTHYNTTDEVNRLIKALDQTLRV